MTSFSPADRLSADAAVALHTSIGAEGWSSGNSDYFAKARLRCRKLRRGGAGFQTRRISADLDAF